MTFFPIENISPHLDELEAMTKGLDHTISKHINAKLWLRLEKVIGSMRRSLTPEQRNNTRHLYDNVIKMSIETNGVLPPSVSTNERDVVSRACALFILCLPFFVPSFYSSHSFSNETISPVGA
jgi:hypothetical protein